MFTLDFQASFHTSSHGATREGIYGTLLNDKDTPNLLHRILMDKERGLYYGYDVVIEKASGGFDVKIASLAPGADRYFAESRWKELCPTCAAPRRVDAAQRFPAPQRIRAGDTISVDLLGDARGGVVSDEIKVNRGLVPEQPAAAKAPRVLGPVDFTPEAVLLRMAKARVFANGEPARSDAGGGIYGSVEGGVVWMDLPGHGRAFVSLTQYANCAFKKIGVLSGDTITFTVDGIRYDLVSAVPIATAGPDPEFNDVQSWNLWVFHDKDWEPFQGQYTIGVGGGCPSPAKVS
jgi:hypothetical protein